MGGHQLASEVLKALAHPVRLKILQLLDEEGEACVCHLEAKLGQRQAYISQQLATLRQVGLVTDQRDGLNVYYAPASGEVKELLSGIKNLVIDLELADLTEVDFSIPSSRQGLHCSCPKCEALRSDKTLPSGKKTLDQTIQQGEI